MKVMYYRVNMRKKNRRTMKSQGFERVLFFLFVITFTIMIIVQATLMNPAIRASLSMNDELEGKPLGLEEFLYSEGIIRLSLLSEGRNPDIKVLVNGEVVGSFFVPSIEITVKDGDVVEIDGSSVADEFEVAILPVTENIASECVNLKTVVNKEVKKLSRIRID